MTTVLDANVHNIALRGTFDDGQRIVKELFNDLEFKGSYQLGAVNSINWARVVAQVVYYFKGYFAATSDDAQSVDFAVPSGNFGNILAAHVAREMGLPVRRLILATNENDVLDEFFRTGRYRVRKGAEVHATSSPSMDISKSSNFERYVFDLVGRDAGEVRKLWAQLDREGAFDISATPFFQRLSATGFVSGSSTHSDRIATMRRIWKDYGVMIDTHTADGVKVALEQRESGVPIVCLETAQPAKFADTIREALGRDPERPPGFENLETLPQRFQAMNADVAAIKDYIARHAGTQGS